MIAPSATSRRLHQGRHDTELIVWRLFGRLIVWRPRAAAWETNETRIRHRHRRLRHSAASWLSSPPARARSAAGSRQPHKGWSRSPKLPHADAEVDTLDVDLATPGRRRSALRRDAGPRRRRAFATTQGIASAAPFSSRSSTSPNTHRHHVTGTIYLVQQVSPRMVSSVRPHPDQRLDRRLHARHFQAVYNGTQAFIDRSRRPAQRDPGHRRDRHLPDAGRNRTDSSPGRHDGQKVGPTRRTTRPTSRVSASTP